MELKSYNKLLVLSTIVIIFSLVLMLAECGPISGSYPDCAEGTEIRDICELCAKESKSKNAYPLCCQNKDGVREYCIALLNHTMNRH